MLQRAGELLSAAATISVERHCAGIWAEVGLVVAKGIGRSMNCWRWRGRCRLPGTDSLGDGVAQHVEGLDESIDAIDDDIARRIGNPKAVLIDQVPASAL